MIGSHNNYATLRNGVSWSAFERFAVQGLQFIVFVFMARVLSPTDYGLVGMLAFFIVISQLIAEGGLSQAIIRKLDRDETDLSTSFYVNIAGGVMLYLLLFVSAPAIADFYEEQQLVWLLRAMALCVVIQSSLIVHRAVLTAKLDFKTQAKSTFIGALSSGLVGIYMAYRGYGAWAIVGLQLTNQIATAVTLWIVTSWRPKRLFSVDAFKRLYGFGCKLLMSKVIESIYNSFYIMTIGKVFSAYALGCYTNARQLGSISSENLTRIVQRAAFPMFCGFQQDRQKLQESISKYFRLAVFFITPLLMGLAALAEPLTVALIGQQWIYTARLLRILCFYFLFFPLNSINYMILEITGSGNLYLKLQVTNILLGISFLAIMIPFGLSAVCVGIVVSYAISYAINARMAGGQIGFGLIRQIKSIFPTLIISLITACMIYGIQFIVEGEWFQVLLGIIIGLLTYGGLSMAFQTDLCAMLSRIIRKQIPA